MGADRHPTTDPEEHSDIDIPDGLETLQEMEEDEVQECLMEMGLDVTTESEQERHPLTNDVGFGILITVYLGVWTWLHLQGGEVFWVMDLSAAIAFLTAVIWGYGQGAAKAAGDILGGDQR